MKTYNFSVSVKEFNDSKSSIIDSFINEAKDEERQLEITHAINKETSKTHREILLDFTDEINEELGKIGTGFKNIEVYNEYNMCGTLKTRCKINDIFFVISLEPIRNKLFKDSKYTTYTGEYEMRISRYLESWNQKVTSVQDVLNYMKRDIIEEIKKN